MASPDKSGPNVRPLVAASAEDTRGEGSSTPARNARPAFKPVMDYTDHGATPFLMLLTGHV
jgi:hypothetical protein